VSGGRRALALLALVLAGTTAGLVAAEVLARLTWRVPPAPAPVPWPPGMPLLFTQAQLAKPNVTGIYNGAVFHTNSAAFRGREYSTVKPPGVFRIVVAGDSVTMGSGVADDEAYPALLEQALNARGDRHYEVLNLGLIALNISQVLARVVLIGQRFHPDLIVYGCTINDIGGRNYRRSMGPTSRIMQERRYTRFAASPSYALRLAWPHLISLIDLLHPQPGTYLFEVRDNYFNNPQAWNQFTAGLDSFARYGRSVHVPVVVFIHTWLEYLNAFHGYRDVYAKIAQAAEERGMPAIQSFPALRGHDEESLWVSKLDAHPNAAGHRLLAQALREGLERLPARYWQPHPTAAAAASSP